MMALLRSLRMDRWDFWKARKYIAWRLHTVYGVEYEAGLMKAIRQVIGKIGLRRFIIDGMALNRWLKDINKLR